MAFNSLRIAEICFCPVSWFSSISMGEFSAIILEHTFSVWGQDFMSFFSKPAMVVLKTSALCQIFAVLSQTFLLKFKTRLYSDQISAWKPRCLLANNFLLTFGRKKVPSPGNLSVNWMKGLYCTGYLFNLVSVWTWTGPFIIQVRD